MASNQTSVEFGTLRERNVEEAFRTLVADAPLLVSLFQNIGGVTHHKHEWLDDVKLPTTWTLNGAVDTSATTTIVLDANSGVKVGDILGFKGLTGASRVQQAKVTAVDGGGANLTVTWLAATTNDLVDDDIAFLIARPRAEGSDESFAVNVLPLERYNYTQIFRRDFKLTRTLLQSKLYGLATQAARDGKIMDLVDYQALNQMRDIMYELNNSIINGYREARVDGGANGSMGGLLSFVTAAAASQYDASASAVSATIINNALAKAIANGGNPAEMTVMLMHTRQARKISAFNNSALNITRQDIGTGNYVARFTSDLSGSNGGAESLIVVDRSFPEDKILILNPNDVKIADMQEMIQEETTLNKVDARTFKILGEKTLEVHNANTNMMLITNLGL